MSRIRVDMMNKCKYLTIRTKNYEKYFYCRLNKKIINYTTECIKCVKSEPRKNKSINKVSKKRITVSKETYNKVIERDHHCCRLSDKNCDGWLELHHVKYRSEAKELINEPSNCIMLCTYHHKKVHQNKHFWQPKLIDMNKKRDTL